MTERGWTSVPGAAGSRERASRASAPKGAQVCARVRAHGRADWRASGRALAQRACGRAADARARAGVNEQVCARAVRHDRAAARCDPGCVLGSSGSGPSMCSGVGRGDLEVYLVFGRWTMIEPGAEPLPSGAAKAVSRLLLEKIRYLNNTWKRLLQLMYLDGMLVHGTPILLQNIFSRVRICTGVLHKERTARLRGRD